MYRRPRQAGPTDLADKNRTVMYRSILPVIHWLQEPDTYVPRNPAWSSGKGDQPMTLGHEVKQRSAADQYNYEAEQVLLRALDGAGGTWERHGPKTNLRDIVSEAANDNNHKE